MAAKRQKSTSIAGATPVDSEEILFRTVADALANEYAEVTWGKMMSSPGVRFRDKFFAFYYKEQMVCRFGRDFQPEAVGITNYSLLSPFKIKPPLRDWFCITVEDGARWQALATLALQKMAGDELTQRPSTSWPSTQPSITAEQ